MDIRDLVEDLQTFPLNEDREVKVEEFLQRLNNLAMAQKEESDESSQEDQSRVESDMNIDSIIEESKSQRKTATGSQSMDRNTESDDEIINSVFGIKRQGSL